MFPRTYGFRRTYVDLLSGFQCTYTVGNYSVKCPITSSDDIACTYAGQRYGMFLAVVIWIEKRTAPTLDGYFSCPFTGRIWVVTTKWIRFYIAVHLFVVIVALICGNHNTNFYRCCSTDRFHYVNRTHNVHLIGFNGDFVA